MLRFAVDRVGYLHTHLGSRYQNTVHAIVAFAFFGPLPRGMCVAHKNAIKGDNRIDNLQYTTRAGNMAHCRREGSDPCPLLRTGGNKHRRIDEKERGFHAFGEAHGMSTIKQDVAEKVHEMLAKGMLRTEIAEELGRPYDWVASVASGRRWRHVHPDPSLRR